MSANLATGEIFEETYELREKIDATASQERWVIRDTAANQTLTLCLLKTKVQSERLSLIQKRLGAAQGLIHPNILLAIKLDAYKDYPYVIEPWSEKLTTLKLEDINWQTVEQVLDALAFSHQLGISHGFIHPENLLIDQDKRLQIRGFGLPNEFKRDKKHSEFILSKDDGSYLPAYKDDYHSIGRLIAYSMSPSGELSLDTYSSDMSSQVAETISSLIQEPPSNSRLDLREIKLILSEYFEEKTKTIEVIKYKDNEEDKGTIEAITKAGNPKKKFLTVAFTISIVLFLSAIYLFNTLNYPTESTANLESETLASESEIQTLVSPREIAESVLEIEQGEEFAKQFLRSQIKLQDIGVNVWGDEKYKLAQSLFDKAENLFLEGRHGEALENYMLAAETLKRLEESAPNVLEANVKEGKQALEEKNYEDAIVAFSVANAIKRNDPTLQALQERANNLEAVLVYMSEALLNEKREDNQKALDLYKAAADLDREWAPAFSGIKRVKQKIKELHYLAMMSEATKALANEEYKIAKKKFREAGSLFPDRIGYQEGLLRAEQKRVTNKANSHVRLAEENIASFNWKEAEENYKKALELAPDLVEPRASLEKVKKQLAILKNLERLSEDPTLLQSQLELLEGKNLIEVLSNQNKKSSKTVEQLKRLEHSISLARIKIPILLTSDNQSDVTIERIQHLGKFREIEIGLIPGVYAITSSRPGFRDIRKVLRVLPDFAENQLYIANSEAVR